MCYAWVKQSEVKELTIDEIREIFKDRLLRNNLEIINITGGEPTLRSDLTEIIRIILKNCIRLTRIDISTNGVNTSQVIDKIERILAVLLPTNVKLTVSISLDGIGEVYELIRGKPNIFNNVDKTIDKLKELLLLYPFFSLGLNMTIGKLNYYAIEEVRKYAQHKGIGVNFTLAAISEIGVESIHMREKFEMSQEEKNKLILSLEELWEVRALKLSYINFLFTWLRRGIRNGSCAFRKNKAFLLEPDGDIYICGNFKEFKIGNVRDESFERIWKRRTNRLRDLSNRCLHCVSNCYMDEVR
jgi:MoaA/NifB/PqqE/SkfB family radical SAM enzyme